MYKAIEKKFTRRQFIRAGAVLLATCPVLSAPAASFLQLGVLAPETRRKCSITRRDLEDFLVSFLKEKMAQYEIPGAAFSFVQNDAVILSKGFGFADLENGRKMSPSTTLMRAYSVSKAFTATAVMQLVDRGKLKLDENVNNYLRLFKIKDNFPEPITLAHLLTHTAGFVDTPNETILARGELRELSLGQWLAKYLPSRTKPVGAEVRYSNFGASLAGHIVEVVSGEPYHQYMKRHILRPLGMNQSGFLWPADLPAHMATRVAVGYKVENNQRKRMTRDEGDFACTPAANLLTTADEMTRFMLAHLQKGLYGSHRLVQPATMDLMHEPWKFRRSAKDIGYGFFWRPVKGQNFSFLFHGGGWDGAVSDLELLPSHNLGYFFWYNQGKDDDRKLRAELNAKLIAEFFSRC
jgi:CubicO group peptidase (beta-lactamase class C family)